MMRHSELSMLYSDALGICLNMGGTIATLDLSKYKSLVPYLRLWKHDYDMGDIWLHINDGFCQVIHVSHC